MDLNSLITMATIVFSLLKITRGRKNFFDKPAPGLRGSNYINKRSLWGRQPLEHQNTIHSPISVMWSTVAELFRKGALFSAQIGFPPKKLFDAIE